MDERGVSYKDLMSSAERTAHGYLRAAVASVDEVLGKGSAAKFPQLVVAFMDAASKDYHASMLSHRIAPALEALSESVRTAGESIAEASRE